VRLETFAEPSGLTKDRDIAGLYRWRANDATWKKFAAAVEPLSNCTSQTPGHRVLTCGVAGETPVVISCGEPCAGLAAAGKRNDIAASREPIRSFGDARRSVETQPVFLSSPKS
jgi:hypothetical protein